MDAAAVLEQTIVVRTPQQLPGLRLRNPPVVAALRIADQNAPDPARATLWSTPNIRSDLGQPCGTSRRPGRFRRGPRRQRPLHRRICICSRITRPFFPGCDTLLPWALATVNRARLIARYPRSMSRAAVRKWSPLHFLAQFRKGQGGIDVLREISGRVRGVFGPTRPPVRNDAPQNR